LLAAAIGLGRGGLTPCVNRSVALRALAVALGRGRLLALGELRAQPLPFLRVLVAGGLELGLGLMLLGLPRAARSLGFGVGLGLLQPPLAGELLVPGNRPEGGLRLADELADASSGGVFSTGSTQRSRSPPYASSRATSGRLTVMSTQRSAIPSTRPRASRSLPSPAHRGCSVQAIPSRASTRETVR
jgi:hypothetical protein